MTEGNPSRRRFSRRAVLGAAAGVGVAGAAVAIGIDQLTGGASSSDTVTDIVPFYGEHQAGIDTAAQRHLHFAAFDVTISSRDQLVAMLKEWSDAAARMTKGEFAADLSTNELSPPADTGEALGHSAANVTITIGFGPTLFDSRFGLADKKPPALIDIPGFDHDDLDPNRVGGDICVQACADDPQVAFHAVRNLTRIGRGVVVMLWSQLGFGRTSSTSQAQDTPRNLMGFKDGTNNIKSEDKRGMADHVWVSDGPAWLHGGTYLVARRIRMLIENWDRASHLDQEQTIGRAKESGAPLGGKTEFDTVDLNAKDSAGDPVITADAHIRLAAPSENSGERILRRGYSFTDGMDAYGELDAGLFFIAFQRDPASQFVAIQRKLSKTDALNEYIRHTGSALFAVPPGIQPGDWLGSTLFA